MDALRTVSRLAGLSLVMIVLALPLITAVPALGAGSRLLLKASQGRVTGLWRELPRDVRRALPTTWFLGPASVAVVAISVLNLAFLAGQPVSAAGAFYAVNVSALLIAVWWLAACVHELAEDPGVARSELVRRATSRATRFGPWHLAVLLGAALTVTLVIHVPLVGVIFGPGLALYLGRVATPRPMTSLQPRRGDL
ncbi:hypothetical protein [Ruania halotolerans]|uniref:hypothetical protein n=1 Tax=Ruania halotolerans TaxID=2897773 RepID=UPI001E4B3EA1|nr:hypothetical protein [Ruania halotolerans]UFU07996.1 hypothetical protein LQF10_07825 [Ruania halotolerans]